MFKTKLLLVLLCISIATVVQAQESTPSSTSPPDTAIKSQYGDRGTVEWSGAITGYYSAANTYTTSPAGETRLIQISVAPATKFCCNSVMIESCSMRVCSFYIVSI